MNFLIAGSAINSRSQEPSLLSFQSTALNLNLTLLAESQNNFEKASTFLVSFLSVSSNFSCTNLILFVNQTNNWSVLRLLCKTLTELCCHYITSNKYINKLEQNNSVLSLIYPKISSNNVPCTPNLTHWCPLSYRVQSDV